MALPPGMPRLPRARVVRWDGRGGKARSARPRLTGAGDGGRARALAVVTGTGPGYRMGEALVEVRWGDVHAGTAPQRDESCFTTASPMKPPQRVACYRPRWSIETTCQAGREAWKREATNGDGPPTVRRFTPCVGGLYTSVVRRDLQRPSSFTTRRAVSWPGQSPGPLSARRLGRRRALGHQGCFHPQAQARAFSQLSPSCRATLLSALAPAAYRAGHVMSHGGMFLQGAAYPTGQSRAELDFVHVEMRQGHRQASLEDRGCEATIKQ